MIRWAHLIGRLLFGGFFLFNGVNHFAQTTQLAAYAASHGVPSPELAVLASGVLLLLGGLSVLLGFLPRVGLVLLTVFLVPVTLAMHAFWNVADAQARVMEMVQFMKNVALVGATLGWMAVPVPWPHALDDALRRRSASFARWVRLDRPAHQA